MKYTLFYIAFVLLISCNKNSINKNEKPVARVYNKYLYISDLVGVIPAGTSENDSASVARDFIEKWVHSQLILNKAEINLTDEEKDVDLQIENYRSSLLIYTYQQSYLRQKLDTIVNEKEIEDYFNVNKSNFVLGEPLMKGLFIKVPVKAPEIYKLRQWYRSDDSKNITNLEGYCFKHAAVYDDFNENWVNLNEVLRMIPASGGNNATTYGNRNNLEIKDKDYFYFLNIKEIAAEGTVSPYELVKNDIHYIILNKRKVRLINELEASIYSDAQNHEYFTIYP